MPVPAETDQALVAVRRSWAAGRLAHAYLIVGSPRGAGGALAARLVALLFCDGAGTRPCGACPGCRRTAARAHPDVAWVEPQKKSRGILLEDIKAVQAQVAHTAFEGGWKAVVFLYADRLNPQAANRLLKTLEEPPPRTLMLLVTGQPEVLLPTIVSRCQRIVLPAARAADDGALRAAVVEAMTAVEGRTLAAAIQRARILAAFLKRGREAIEADVASGAQPAGEEPAEEDVSREVRDARIEARYKELIADLLRWLLFWQRDVLFLVSGAGGDPADLLFAEQEDALRRQAESLTYRRALANVRAVDAMRRHIEQNMPLAVVLERGLIQLGAESG